MTKDTIQDFLKFIGHPDDRQIEQNFRERIQKILILFVAEIVITIGVLIPVLFLLNKSLNLEKRIDLNSYSTLTIFTLIVILIPFIEELVFRYFLRFERLRFWRLNISQWNKFFPIVVYLSVLCFGLIHISNYSNGSKWFYIFSPLIVVSQILTGFIITYIRVRLNFLWGVFYHWLWNFIFVIAIPELEGLLNIS